MRFLATTMWSGMVSVVKLSKAGVKFEACLGGGQSGLWEENPEFEGVKLNCVRLS